jgi:hypothetical protein
MSRRFRARAILIALAALLVTAAVLPPLDPVPIGTAKRSDAESDPALFAAVIARVRAGEAYYPAMAIELETHHFPTASAFNWRTPILFKLMAVAPPLASVAALIVLSLTAFVLTVVHMNRLKAPEPVLIGVLAQIGVLCVVLAPAIRLQTEAWAGILIAISALAYTRQRWYIAAAVGITALFVRELAAPYCAVCALLAVRDRRVRELIIWALGGVAYAIFYGWHVLQVQAQHAGERSYAASWIQLGGLRFLLETIQQSNTILLLAPYVATAVFLTFLAAALWAPTIPAHVRATVIAYALFFVFVGQSFNDYWGLLVGPVQAVALAYGPFGLHALFTDSGRDAPGTRAAVG